MAFEGYYWRFSGPGWSVAAIAGVCRGGWAMVTLAAEPGGFSRTAIADPASAAGLDVSAGALLRATPSSLEVDLGPGARLSARFASPREWPRRPFGALGLAQVVPGLGQYWSPWLLGARVTGSTDFGVSLSGGSVYAEKNWGGAFAEHWWWGQAPGLAFAGGRVHGVAPTAVVAWTGDGLVTFAPPLARTVVRAGGGEWRLRTASPRWSVELAGAAAAPLRLAVPIPAERRLEVRSSHYLLGDVSYVVRRGRRVWSRYAGPGALEDGASAPPD